MRRRAIYRAFQALEQEDPPVMVLYYPREIQAMSAPVPIEKVPEVIAAWTGRTPLAA